MKKRPVLTIIVAIALVALIPSIVGPLSFGKPEDILPMWGVVAGILYAVVGIAWFVESGIR